MRLTFGSRRHECRGGFPRFFALLDEARHKSKREVEHIIARLRPQPDVPAVIRKLPVPAMVPVPRSEFPVLVPQSNLPVRVGDTAVATVTASIAPRRPEIKPLAPERYKVQCTISRETHDKLRRVQDLLRHSIPDGDFSAILDRALTVLLSDLSRAKCAATERPRSLRAPKSRSRHIPAAIKRECGRGTPGDAHSREAWDDARKPDS